MKLAPQDSLVLPDNNRQCKSESKRKTLVRQSTN